ncbi:hypothetical protein DUI87_09330 [Hirundo rustica rustica]|uniref:Uncharacterized protein n=1 Tax=Hirundo rustica rustica TaxID=333673 RepID=A0A3M0KLW7_HIRRU|nr:hypothetical protein DUI87_09330 [Hirundo rustica rustica]
MAMLLHWFCMARFGSGGIYRASCCEMQPEASPCSTEIMPASSRMDPLLTKASGITYQSRGINCSGTTMRSETREGCDSKNSADTQVSEDRGEGGAPDSGAEIPLQPVVKTTVRQLCPCSPWGSIVEQRCTYYPWMPKGGRDPVGSPHWTRLLAGPVDSWRNEPTLEEVC